MTTHIRTATQMDHIALLALWYRSVKATHLFLTEQEIDNIFLQLKNQWLDAVELWLLEDNQQIVGFIGLETSSNNHKVEMLFIDDYYQGKGYGSQLINFVKQQCDEIFLDVNEQNPAALKFYLKQGFKQIGRSETDSQGNPFPLIHLFYKK